MKSLATCFSPIWSDFLGTIQIPFWLLHVSRLAIVHNASLLLTNRLPATKNNKMGIFPVVYIITSPLKNSYDTSRDINIVASFCRGITRKRNEEEPLSLSLIRQNPGTLQSHESYWRVVWCCYCIIVIFCPCIKHVLNHIVSSSLGRV